MRYILLGRILRKMCSKSLLIWNNLIRCNLLSEVTERRVQKRWCPHVGRGTRIPTYIWRWRSPLWLNSLHTTNQGTFKDRVLISFRDSRLCSKRFFFLRAWDFSLVTGRYFSARNGTLVDGDLCPRSRTRAAEACTRTSCDRQRRVINFFFTRATLGRYSVDRTENREIDTLAYVSVIRREAKFRSLSLLRKISYVRRVYVTSEQYYEYTRYYYIMLKTNDVTFSPFLHVDTSIILRQSERDASKDSYFLNEKRKSTFS